MSYFIYFFYKEKIKKKIYLSSRTKKIIKRKNRRSDHLKGITKNLRRKKKKKKNIVPKSPIKQNKIGNIFIFKESIEKTSI